MTKVLSPIHSGMPWLKPSRCRSLGPGAVPRPLPEPGKRATLTCFLVSTSRMSIRLIIMFLCVFLYFPTRSETVSQPGRPVHMKVLLPCSFHSRTCNRGTEAELAPPASPEQFAALLPGKGAGKDIFPCQQTFTEPLPSSRPWEAHRPCPLDSPWRERQTGKLRCCHTARQNEERTKIQDQSAF